MIKVIDDWYVTVEPYPINYVVRRGNGKKDKNGKCLDKPRGYFGSLRKAVKCVREQIIADTMKDGERTLEDALRTISSIDKRFEEIMERIDA